MGILRLLLAIWVALVHGEWLFGYKMGQAWIAVQAFFIVSGFYMSLILNEKYKTAGAIRKFYIGRFFRLIPVYFAILILAVGVMTITWWGFGVRIGAHKAWYEHSALLGSHNLPYLGLSQFSVFGQTAACFLGMDGGSGQLYWTPDFNAQPLKVWPFMILPPAWSIEIEMMFYLVAPFIVTKSWRVIGLWIAGSLLLRGFIFGGLGWKVDPWTYRFFPTELALFLFGTVAYKIYRHPSFGRWMAQKWIKPALVGLLILVAAWPFIPIKGQIKAWPLYGMLMVSIPFLFAWTKSISWDRRIGELSYPVYMVHFIIFQVLEAFLPAEWLAHRGSITAVLAVLVAWALLHWLIDPLEKWRQSRLPQTSIA